MNDDFNTALFEPEVILPAQLSRAECDGDPSGARALMMAILEDAILCIERGRRRRHSGTRRLAAEAETWMRSDSRDWLFSFASICDVLGFDVDALRGRLLSSPEHPETRWRRCTRVSSLAAIFESGAGTSTSGDPRATIADGAR